MLCHPNALPRTARIAAALVSLAASVAIAESPQASVAADELTQARFVLEPIFELLDCGDEGYVQAGEVDEHLGQLYLYFGMAREYHQNMRPEMSDAELAALEQTERALHASMDSDGDDAISSLEYRFRLIDLINAADANGDGEVTRRELETGAAD